MRISRVLFLHPQNFAVASASGGAPTPGRSLSVADLEERARSRQADWHRLFSEPDVWNDREKRRAMLEARWAYHEAVAAWLEARKMSCVDGGRI